MTLDSYQKRDVKNDISLICPGIRHNKCNFENQLYYMKLYQDKSNTYMNLFYYRALQEKLNTFLGLLRSLEGNAYIFSLIDSKVDLREEIMKQALLVQSQLETKVNEVDQQIALIYQLVLQQYMCRQCDMDQYSLVGVKTICQNQYDFLPKDNKVILDYMSQLYIKLTQPKKQISFCEQFSQSYKRNGFQTELINSIDNYTKLLNNLKVALNDPFASEQNNIKLLQNLKDSALTNPIQNKLINQIQTEQQQTQTYQKFILQQELNFFDNNSKFKQYKKIKLDQNTRMFFRFINRRNKEFKNTKSIAQYARKYTLNKIEKFYQSIQPKFLPKDFINKCKGPKIILERNNFGFSFLRLVGIEAD